MGQDQDTLNRSGSARNDRRLRPRVCLRKGCERAYQPRCWNQRYCQDPGCQRAVRRWQAAKRQRQHRRIPKNRQRHASAEAARRQRRRETSETAGQGRNYRSENASGDRAWSRGRSNSKDFCDRPGCYQPLRHSPRSPARYCGDKCRQAVRRVRDRERKWLSRGAQRTYRGRHFRRNSLSSTSQSLPGNSPESPQRASCLSVGDYRASSRDGLSCPCHQPRENHHDDPKTRACLGPRSPPTT